MNLVSIIVPVYNVEKYLKKCIDSVISQTYTHWEMILVDDGSTDLSGTICDQIADGDARIKVIHKENEGLSMARNTGICNATGDYVYFLDSDDYIEKDLLKDAVDKLEQGADLCCFGAVKEDENGNRLYDIKFKENEYIFENESEKFRFIVSHFVNYHTGWEVCFRLFSMKIIKKYNLRFVSERKVFAEDYLFTYSYLLYCKKVAIFSKTYYHYLQRENSLMEEGNKHLIHRLKRIPVLARALYDATNNSSCEYIKERFDFIYYLIYEWHQRQLISSLGIDMAHEIYEELMDNSFHRDNMESYKKRYAQYMAEYGKMTEYISVIIPVYNIADYIERCIKSVCSQSCQRYEVILVDDGSTDNGGEICDKYACLDYRIKVIHKENQGLSSARNAGLDVAQGEYIYFLDGDDYIEALLIETSVMALVKNDADMCVFKAWKVRDGVKEPFGYDLEWGLIDISNDYDKYKFLYDKFYTYRIGWEAWNRIYRADIINEHHLRFISERQIFAEDLLFCSMYMVYTQYIMCITDVLYNYVDRASSLMNEKREKIMIKEFNTLASYVWEEYNRSNLTYCKAHFYRLYERIMYWHYGYLFLRVGLADMRPQICEISKTSVCRELTKELLDNKIETRQLYGREDAFRRNAFYRFILSDDMLKYKADGFILKIIGLYKWIKEKLL